MRLAKIKPCPFCGACEGMFVERFNICSYGVMCNECVGRGPPVEDLRYEDSEQLAHRDAIKAWNGRQRARKIWNCQPAVAATA